MIISFTTVSHCSSSLTYTVRKKIRRTLGLLVILSAGIVSPSTSFSQSLDASQADRDPADWLETEVGIPVTDPLTKEKCGACHTADSKENLSRISWTRATPEGWAQTLKRMVKLNGLSLTPDEARAIVRYLSTSHGLAPDEAKPVMYFAEHRILDETIIPNDTLHQTCASCHAFAQVMSSRRSYREWALLQNMHKGLYPTAQHAYDTLVDAQPAHAGEESEPKKQVPESQVALEWLKKNAQLHTPEWAAWSPSIQIPALSGKWFVKANFVGHGPLIGEMTVTPTALGSATFNTETTLRSLNGHQTFSRQGKGLVYAGYSWRGSSRSGVQPTSPDDMAAPMRETMWFAPDQTKGTGRWYWGEYHEFGLDVMLTRETGTPILALVSPAALQSSAQQIQIHLYGDALPTSFSLQDIDMGGGVTIRKIVSATPHEIVLAVDVAANATPGARNVAIRGTVLPKGLTIYSHIDYLKVTPQTSLAHLGGIKYGKGYQQFLAEGWSNGPDGKPGTSDDLLIKPVPVTWSLAEFSTVTYDDDVQFVGAINPVTGLFTPNVEGPNTKRRFMRNNYGEVWVVGTAKTDKDANGVPLVGRSYLVTTVPAYKRWDQPEVSQ
ncbi:quinohemoprotein amine dehydrogenase [Acetobacter senegalensis]|uniref:Quinohemoprotein amine dehydrogenase n=1 Tax=Acetobacter senegalensis TaxID=446692 RepID=A0A149U274_9PROT|nr:quinohemoprotein amine dehydrogenase subunit alpha [Acetobacter senegalensis]KXV59554.1 quinohemoprotein amine dehydrogenase [Acetobacter senegalensis]